MRTHGEQTPEASPLRGSVGPQASTPVGQNIMSMEDDDTSDQEFVSFHQLSCNCKTTLLALLSFISVCSKSFKLNNYRLYKFIIKYV